MSTAKTCSKSSSLKIPYDMPVSTLLSISLYYSLLTKQSYSFKTNQVMSLPVYNLPVSSHLMQNTIQMPQPNSQSFYNLATGYSITSCPVSPACSLSPSYMGLLAVSQTHQVCTYFRALACAVLSAWNDLAPDIHIIAQQLHSSLCSYTTATS